MYKRNYQFKINIKLSDEHVYIKTTHAICNCAQKQNQK